jgi:hypothetical protein
MAKSRTRRSRTKRLKSKRRGGYHERSWFSRLTGSKLVYNPDAETNRKGKCEKPLEEFERHREGTKDSKHRLSYDFQNKETEDAFYKAFPNFNDYEWYNKKYVICGHEGDPMVIYSQYQPQNVDGLELMSKSTRDQIEKALKKKKN